MSYNAPDSEATALGFVLPSSTDLIRSGDNDIKANAKVAAGGIVAALKAAEIAGTRVEQFRVRPENTTFVQASRNLYNPAAADVMVGYVISGSSVSTGQPVASAAYTTTGHIAVTPGASYTLSNARNLAWYTAGGVTISVVDNAPQTPVTAKAPSGAATLRASFYTDTYRTSFQVEKGTSATPFVPYAVRLVGVELPVDDRPITADRTDFAVPSRNLYNPAGALAGHVLSGAAATKGQPVPLASYTVTGHIAVTAGQSYTLSSPRNLCWYASDGAPLTFVDNSGQGVLTSQAPAGATTLRASFLTTSAAVFQIEKGTSATAFVPYGVSIPGLSVEVPAAGAIKVTRTGPLLNITTALDGAQLVQTASLTGSANGAFNWQSTLLDGVARHSPSDSITPLRTTMGTVGANHGFPQVRDFANPDAKSTADLGSTWTDGARTYTLVQITPAGRLVLAGPATTTSGATSTSTVAPAADLTHVAGATKTATILASSIGAAMQLYPSVRDVAVTATLDGAPLAEGRSSGQVLRVIETYTILDYADLLAKMQTTRGTPYTALAVDGALRVSVLYEMRAPGTWLVSTTVTALKPALLGASGFVQSEALATPSGGSLWRWVPGVKPINGYDFHAGVNMTTYAVSLLVTSSDLIDPTKPPTWMIEWARDSAGNDVLGFAHGYTPDKTDGSWAARVANAPANYWDLRSTKKSYPTALSGKALAPGERVSVQAWRAYLPPSRPHGLAVQDAQAAYGYARTVGAAGRPARLPEQVGRTIIPLVEQGLTIAPGVVDADGLTLTGTGHAVAKLT